MKFEDLPENIQERLNHSYWAVYLYNHSLNELHLISDVEYTPSQLKIVNSHTFDFYRITLHYCFVMEYNKLLEIGRRDSQQNISSLIQLNDAVRENLGAPFQRSHAINHSSLASIRDSDFFTKMRDLRDKKFGHSDSHDINKPFSFRGFKTEDFKNGVNHLRIIKQVIDTCTSPFDLSLDIDIPNREDRTHNFIQFHAKYQDYYFNNYLEAEFGLKK